MCYSKNGFDHTRVKNGLYLFGLYTLYSSGMRLNEILNLRTQDLWWDRDQIMIKNGKGKKVG